MAKNFPLSVTNRSNFLLSGENILTFTALIDTKFQTDKFGFAEHDL